MTELYKRAIEEALEKVKMNIERFGRAFPHTSTEGVYSLNDNTDWTDGFWVGVIWQAYEYSKDDVFLIAAREKTAQMKERLLADKHLDTHDIGFLYTPTTGAKWQIEQDKEAKELTVKAANRLMERYREDLGIIQAWGPFKDPALGGRIIIDCMMNMPLLFSASALTGDVKYKKAAVAFVDNARKYLVRGDDSTYHTFYFDQNTGQPERGATHQGYADGSTWTRGQAWAVLGFALAYHYTGNPDYLETSLRTAKYFIKHLPDNYVAHWDFDAPIDEHIKPDSSASAIAACGFHELLQSLEPSSKDYQLVKEALEKSMKTMITEYASKPDEQGLLDHGSYSVRDNNSPDDFVIWGDYFYMEALLRMEKDLRGYWYN
ncbi:glycoside hydrolase family 88 protein [Marinilactibacillus kalidii]|uniref:glycoside hydrolase family 88 protein n=1 Tax=Marinilactibacillus kalidii TaxID=2820274 RepID=UPI001ABE3ED5|nr:glycoside hydrolase family 88 protein [Marinilactibacillus kalidii]